MLFEPHHKKTCLQGFKKTCLQGFGPGLTHTAKSRFCHDLAQMYPYETFAYNFAVLFPGEQTQVSVSGRTSVTKSISSEHPPEIHTPTPQENNVFDPEEEG